MGFTAAAGGFVAFLLSMPGTAHAHLQKVNSRAVKPHQLMIVYSEQLECLQSQFSYTHLFAF